jgi:hypothetical protein
VVVSTLHYQAALGLTKSSPPLIFYETLSDRYLLRYLTTACLPPPLPTSSCIRLDPKGNNKDSLSPPWFYKESPGFYNW